MNNPFFYEPSAECVEAAKTVADWLNGRQSPFCDHPVDTAFRAEVDKGKMFGVLIVEPVDDSAATISDDPKPQISILNPKTGKPLIYIAAYSGQVCGRADWPEFVPAVFDYLQPDGYFKRHEAEITEINKEISDSAFHDATPAATASTPRPATHKGRLDGESDEEYIRRRQFENAELHRWKLRERERQAKADAIRRQEEGKINKLKTLRRQKSDDLQRWLFRHFRMIDGRGETSDLLHIFGDAIPPSGSGECCEPKLLQYAFTHGLKPIAMAMFWWGESPKAEVRHHLHFYPACNSKCKPILRWMLQGIAVDPNPLESKEQDAALEARLKILYEDDAVCVVSKPAGLLAVPGKSGRESVKSIMLRRLAAKGDHTGAESPLIVHRLDMDTSGLMVIAKTMEAYHDLQRQFACHGIKKRYVAVLEKDMTGASEGVISLPLRPDLDDRPRQVVDFDNGREAVTLYKMVDKRRVLLWPQTGRTHQLRLHCAHRLGLGNPIMGDRLYGNGQAGRLLLHAEELTFTHPVTGRSMTFTDKAPF